MQREHSMASIVVTHDLQSAKTIASHLALLHEGSVVVEGAFADLEKSDDKFVADFMRRDN
jgi:ABC-type transporter Mla maintaining outer membrane lipid asymmetry ATPase subunit MlaF